MKLLEIVMANNIIDNNSLITYLGRKSTIMILQFNIRNVRIEKFACKLQDMHLI